MDTDELLRLAGSKDFKKNLETLAKQTKAHKDSEIAMRKERERLDAALGEIRAREEAVVGRELAADSRNTVLLDRQAAMDERFARLMAKEDEVAAREREAAAEMGKAEQMQRDAQNLHTSAEAERARFERRNAHLAGMPE